jgi:hypothetical protein
MLYSFFLIAITQQQKALPLEADASRSRDGHSL